MPRYELSVSPEYVKDWGVKEAIREIFQNALDQEQCDPDNKMEWEYIPNNSCLKIYSKNSSLSKDTLLFGVSTKADDVKTIGMFGEGYKLALLVLTRLDHKVTIYNNAEKEVWRPKIINSRRYQSKILVIDIEKSTFSKRKDFCLSFEIEGINDNIFEEIRGSNLHIQPPKDSEKNLFGSILFEDKYAGCVFINGLFVCKKGTFRYGYDVLPEFLSIGRDRNLIGDFDLSWVTSKMWAATDRPGLANSLAKEAFPDVEYLSSFVNGESKISETMYADFLGSYGKVAVPVSSQEEFDKVKNSYKKLRPIIVESSIKYIISSFTDDLYISAVKRKDPRKPKEVLTDFYDKYSGIFIWETGAEIMFKEIIKASIEWELK